MLKKFLKTLFFILMLVIAGLLIVRSYVVNRSVPDYNENLTLGGLKEPVTVHRDSFAIPHIYAKSDWDLYYATGFIMAQERLWQMDLLRRVTLGRLSEIFGAEFIDSDQFLRALDYPAKSLSILKDLDPEIQRSLDAYSEGVNEYIRLYEKKLPLEFSLLGYIPEPWEPEHSLNLIGYMAWDLEAGWSEVILESLRPVLDSARYFDLIPDIVDRTQVVFPEISDSKVSKGIVSANAPLAKLGLDVFSASNNWAVGPEKSVYDMPLFANDMHLTYNVPGIWLQMHQVVEGGVNVTGVSLPGQPFVIVGHNERIAWGMTNTYVDNVDLYEEKVNSDSTKYLYNEQWYEFSEKKEKILIKGGKTVTVSNMFTHRGPIVSGFKGIDDRVVSMHWVGHEPSNEMKTIYDLNRAGNWDEFIRAAEHFKAISQNINYADIDGNIGLYTCAGVPVRKRVEGLYILPGWTDEFDWQGFVPFEELPHTFNPATEMVVSANNKTTDNSYPYHIGSWYALPHRFERISELLTQHDKLSVESFMRIQTDTYSKLAEQLLPSVLKALGEIAGSFNTTEALAVQILMEWNLAMSANEAAPLIFENLYLEIIRQAFEDELGENYTAYLSVHGLPKAALHDIWHHDSPWWDNVLSEDVKEQKYDIIQRAFDQTIDVLSAEIGNDPSMWNWSRMHHLTLEHPMGKVKALDLLFGLNRRKMPVTGSFHTIAPYSYRLTKPFDVYHGASQRHIYVVGDWDKSISVIPTGISGLPGSDHYLDQTSLYLNGQYHPDWFSKEKVLENAKYTCVLEPVHK